MIFSIAPIGNIGNRMLEFMAALAIGNEVGGEITYNVKLPEWNFSFDKDLHQTLLEDTANVLLIRDIEAQTIKHVVGQIQSNPKKAIIFEGHFQRVSLFLEPNFYRNFFPNRDSDNVQFTDDELIISVRSAQDLRDGISFYPLTPLNFYKHLVKKTGLRPVFLGQIDQSQYVNEIRDAFPEAKFIPSVDAKTDFNRLRQAKNICIAVSTFSWLAAWLSEAKEIHYPLLGFLHPRYFRFGTFGLGGINLTTPDDPRYRFHLLPTINGEQEEAYLRFVNSIDPISKEISRAHVQLLGKQASILPPKYSNIGIDEQYYLKAYIDAAWEISEGWHLNAEHHYTETGSLRGYKPHAALYCPNSTNISQGKSATQSSISAWSIGKTISEDACRALNGNIEQEMAFCTENEESPWWMVDLGEIYDIECINIFNRKAPDFVRKRATPLAIDFSIDGLIWSSIQPLIPDYFGTENEKINSIPFQWINNFEYSTRYLRIRLLKKDFLHLGAVEVFGRKSNQPSKKDFLRKHKSFERSAPIKDPKKTSKGIISKLKTSSKELSTDSLVKASKKLELKKSTNKELLPIKAKNLTNPNSKRKKL